MMSMTEKRLDNSYFKAFLWNKKWGRPFESLFGLMLNFCRVNAISGRTAAKLLLQALQALRTIHEETRTGKEPRPDDECMMYDLLQSEQNTAGMQAFLNMSRETRTQVFCRCLQYCPECMKVGYHSVFHQLVNA